MIEFFPQEIHKAKRLDILKVGVCFSTVPVGDNNFEIFITARPKPNTILINADGIPAVSLKTGILRLFLKLFVVYPHDLRVIYSYQH